MNDSFNDTAQATSRLSVKTAALSAAQARWKILIVDDEKEVHVVTKLALRDYSFEGKSLEFFSAFTAEEAFRLLAEQADIAVIFLDVALETQDAGLTLATRIRRELNNSLVRIVVRSGQAGSSCEDQVVATHPVNDFKLKTELTAPRLRATLTGSLRAYGELIAIDMHHRSVEEQLISTFTDGLRSYRNWLGLDRQRTALDRTVSSDGAWCAIPSMDQFIDGVMSQTTAMLAKNQHAITAQNAHPAASAVDCRRDGRQTTQTYQADDGLEYEVTSGPETLSILRQMCEAGSLMTFYFNDGFDFLLSSLLVVSPDGKTLVFESGSDPVMNRKLLRARDICCVSSQDRIKIRFQLDGARSIDHQGHSTFLANTPPFLLRLQRRQCYRLAIPLADPLRASIGVTQKDGSVEIVQAIVFDISVGGVCLILSPERTNIKVGDEIRSASITLPDVGIISSDLDVRNTLDIRASNGKILRRAGCSFARATGTLTTMVQRYIALTERRYSLRN